MLLPAQTVVCVAGLQVSRGGGGGCAVGTAGSINGVARGTTVLLLTGRG